ncbi:endonuclease, partial [Arthrobacter sp. S39]
MGRAAVAKAFADIDAAYAVLSAEVDGTGSGADADDDPMQDTSDLCLDILAGAARSEPRMAALKAQAAAKYADNVQAMAPPTMSAQAQEASTAAEIACVLTIG